MANSILFGDVFRFREDFFVFLASSPDGFYYAAKIISKSQTQAIESQMNRLGSSGAIRLDNLLFCFVKLSTPQFVD